MRGRIIPSRINERLNLLNEFPNHLGINGAILMLAANLGQHRPSFERQSFRMAEQEHVINCCKPTILRLHVEILVEDIVLRMRALQDAGAFAGLLVMMWRRPSWLP